MTAEARSGDETVPAPTSETGDGGSLAVRATAVAPGGTMGRFVVIGVLAPAGWGGAGVEARARLQRVMMLAARAAAARAGDPPLLARARSAISTRRAACS